MRETKNRLPTRSDTEGKTTGPPRGWKAPFLSARGLLRNHTNMASETAIQTEGKIISVLAGTMFRVELNNKHLVLAHISGKMRKRFIRLTCGDRVRLEISPYDLSKARIVYRLG